MSCIACKSDTERRLRIEAFAEVLRTQAHTLMPEVSEEEFYRSGILRGALERMRGQVSATMGDKRDFVKRVLNFLEDGAYIRGWEQAGSQNRYDYQVNLRSGRIAAIELKGCMDGNNTNIFERPPQANEFIIWSVCTNKNADPEKDAWSGIHTRLSAEIIHRKVCVDGVIIWDMLCNTEARRCPKVTSPEDKTDIGQYLLPPPCIYLLPATVPTPRNNGAPVAQSLDDVEFLGALHRAFRGSDSDIQSVHFEVRQKGRDIERLTRIMRNGVEQRASRWTAIRRS